MFDFVRELGLAGGYTALISVLDTFFYGYIYETRIKTGLGVSKFYVFLFRKYRLPLISQPSPVFYRILQKTWEIAGLYYILIYSDAFRVYGVPMTLLGLFLGHLVALYDYNFYALKSELYTLEVYEREKIRTYWLFYGIGYFTLQPFTERKFQIQVIIGYVLIILCCATVFIK